MKKIATYKEFVSDSELKESINEAQAFLMTIGDFSDAFIKFYEFIADNENQMDKDTFLTIKKAIPTLTKAWKMEAEAHGNDFISKDVPKI